LHCKIDFLKIGTQGRFGQLISGFKKEKKYFSTPGPGLELATLSSPGARGAHQTTAPTRLDTTARGKLDYITIRVARTDGQRDVPKQRTQCNTLLLNCFCFVLGGNFISLKIQVKFMILSFEVLKR